jgi:hypothetical protein
MKDQLTTKVKEDKVMRNSCIAIIKSCEEEAVARYDQ